VLKKKYNLQKQIYLKHNYKSLFLEKLLTLSLARNHSIDPIDRLTYLSRDSYLNNLYFKWSTFQKLTCLISLSTKVPSKGYNYSRFFLNKQLNKLVISNTLK